MQGVGGSMRLILFLHPEDIRKEMVRLAVRDMEKNGHHINEPSSSRVCANRGSEPQAASSANASNLSLHQVSDQAGVEYVL